MSPAPSFHTSTHIAKSVAASSDTLRVGLLHGFDSGEVADRIYAHRPGGRFLVGRLIDAHVLGLPACESLRQRKNLVRMALRGAIGSNIAPARVMDLGCGAARYVIEALRADAARPPALATCVDLDGACLRLGQRLARRSNTTGLTFMQADALDIARLTPYAPTIVVASGLFESLHDDRMRDALQLIKQLLRPATLIFTARTASPPPTNAFEALIAPETVRVRPLAALEAWTRAAGFATVASAQTDDGAHTVITAGP